MNFELRTYHQELEQAFEELSDYSKYDDGFEVFDIAELVEDLNRKAARFGAPIEPEAAILTPREGLIRVGRLLNWCHEQVDAESKKLDLLLEKISRLESQSTRKEWYTIKEAAEKTGLAEYTLRQGCNKGRFEEAWVQKKRDGKWRMSHVAIETIRNQGLPACC
ncbi:MerR family transcriptional regulator [Thalassoroseus pseudoceratinae]|uniref:hypothetical protein n=1 Tax=Thalassoroseus pseudoceratinae TaxID=2713176 RepID=UPI00142001EF|nr:hypothetical protein [Thalassoroseus pseudoceratinae]